MNVYIYCTIREKMVFFTRKGLTVPEFPALTAESLYEEDDAADTSDICVPTIPPLPLGHAPAYYSTRHNTTAAPTYSESVAAAAAAAATKNATPPSAPVPSPSTSSVVEEGDEQYDYVVDRTLGVQV